MRLFAAMCMIYECDLKLFKNTYKLKVLKESIMYDIKNYWSNNIITLLKDIVCLSVLGNISFGSVHKHQNRIELVRYLPKYSPQISSLRYQCTPNLLIFQKNYFSLFKIDLIAIFHLKKII